MSFAGDSVSHKNVIWRVVGQYLPSGGAYRMGTSVASL